METIGSWLRKNAKVVIMLLAIFGLALFLRAYFPLGESIQEHLLSGGSDSFYWERIIKHTVSTGKQLDWDPLLNYPMGLGNPRPPLFSWFVAVPGMVFSPLVGDVWQSVVSMLILSTAIWGALTIFPTYFLAKNIFGRKAGLIAAFLLAVMPAHLQRSQATDADHDSLVLFFVVTSFFFFMKALEALNERRWVSSWNVTTKDGRSSIRNGLLAFFRENQKAVLYSAMSGMAMATVALTWQGWAYAPIILLVYVVLQLIVDRLRNKDPMGMGICFTITMGIALLLAAPWYVLYGQVKVWYDVPLILFLVAAALGFVLTVTRDYPWAMIIPSVLGVGAAILAILVIVSPAVATAFVSGAGYFVRTKLYETIAEAQAPGLSQAILSFGAVTYYFSLFGLFWMAWKLPKRLQPDYLFILTWSFAAVFMAMAAARFIFNAGPAFAVTAGWVIVLMLGWLDFDSMKKKFSSLSGGSKLTAIRKSVKIKHVLGSLFIVFLLLLPNVWYGVDAAIPYEQKATYDRQVYYTLPEFMRPEGYTPPSGRSGGTFYFGAFGYSLPLPTGYFPAAWDWFAEQDTHTDQGHGIPPSERPAYLSWWDYGFEAVDRGEHPTVADNFQDGYQLAGQFITAQSEDTAIALLTIRLIEGDYYGNKGSLGDSVTAALERHGVDPSKIEGAYQNPSPLIDKILSDPITYGRWDARMQPANAVYIYLSHYIDSVTTTDQLADLYHDIRTTTGWSIRYFGVDSRMFPLTGSGNNIFYAPVKLSDHRVQELPDGRVLPIDFFNIEAQTDKGTFPAADVPLGAQISSLDIKYTDMFYNSMFYRAYMGFGPEDVNQACESKDCIPGIRGDLQSMMPMQGWNMEHFKVVYKTSYYNPWGVNEYQNHSEDWTAINYFGDDGALNLQRKINRGESTGVIDFSNQTLTQSGVVFLKYYDGAYINGTVTVDGTTPLPGVRVTVQDYEDPTNPTPHYSVLTDANGRYSLLAPFGQIRIVASIGSLNPRTMTGATVLDQQFLRIRDDQAMRLEVDKNGDGLADYNIALNIIVRGVTISGTSFLDANRDGNQTSGEAVVSDAQISFKHRDLGLVRNLSTDADGRYLFNHAYEGVYIPTLKFRGRTITAAPITVGRTDDILDVPLNMTKLEGTVFVPGNITASGAIVLAYDEIWGNSYVVQTGGSGQYGFDLLSGNYTISANRDNSSALPQHIKVEGDTATKRNLTLLPSGLVEGKTSIGGLLQGNVLLNFRKVGASQFSTTALSDATGSYSIRLPAGIYEVNSRHYKQSQLYAFIGRVTAEEGVNTTFDPNFSEGVLVQGIAYSVDKTKGGIGGLNITFNTGHGSITTTTSRLDGSYLVYLPRGQYVIQTGYFNLTYLKREDFFASQPYDIELEVGTPIYAQVFYDKNRNQFIEPDEGLEDVRVTFTDSSGVAAETFSRSAGHYELTLPSTKTYLMQFDMEGFQTLSLGPATLQGLAPRFTSAIIPRNISVTGQLLLQGSPLVGQSVEVEFVGIGTGAISASTTTNPSSGRYAVDLAPGNYELKVDQPVVVGQEDVRFQNSTSDEISLKVGEESVARDLNILLRVSVKGNVQVMGELKPASMAFQGPEMAEFVAENGTFDLMLAEGEYTLYASFSENDLTYATIQSLSILAPTQLQVGLEIAAEVVGQLKFENSALFEVAPVEFIRDQGARFNATTDSDGSYSVKLVPGNYTVNVDFPGNATIDYVQRYVRYTHSSTVTVEQNRILVTHDLNLSRTLDNSTIRGHIEYDGLPAAARLEFRPISPDGINATAVASADGTYSVQLAAGPYTLYVHDPVSHGVTLQNLQVEIRTSTYMNLSLERGFKVSGITTYLNHVRIPSRAIFQNSASWDVYSDSTGYFEIFMPAQRYTIRVSTILQENGLNVGYNNTIARTVEADMAIGEIPMVRIPRHGVYLSYDETQVAEVKAGAEISYLIKVWNSGSMRDTIKLEGATVGWSVKFDRDLLDMNFGTVNGQEVNTTYVTATIKVPFGARVEHEQVSITGYCVNATLNRHTLKLKVDVERTRGLVLRTTEVKPVFDGRSLNYTLEISNTGNAAELVNMSIDNAASIETLGWRAKIAAGASIPPDKVVLGIAIGANTSTRVTVNILNEGGRSGVNVVVKANITGGPESVIQIPTTLPQLTLDGYIVVAGGGIERQATPNWTLITVTASVAVVATIFVAMAARDRWRKSRR